MFRLFFKKPYLFFLALGLLTLLVAASYFRYEPDAYFDLSGNHTLTVSSAIGWSVISGYTLVLAAVYYIAARGNLKTYPWLVLTHFIFGILFLLLFAVFSSLNTSFVQDHLTGLPLYSMIMIYAIVLILDLVMFVIGLVLLIINIFTLRRR